MQRCASFQLQIEEWHSCHTSDAENDSVGQVSEYTACSVDDSEEAGIGQADDYDSVLSGPKADLSPEPSCDIAGEPSYGDVGADELPTRASQDARSLDQGKSKAQSDNTKGIDAASKGGNFLLKSGSFVLRAILSGFRYSGGGAPPPPAQASIAEEVLSAAHQQPPGSSQTAEVMVNYVGIVAPQAPVPHDAGMAAAADNGAEVAGPLLNPSPSPKLLSPRDTAFHPAAAAASPQRDQVLLPGAANASALALDDTSAALDSEPVTPSRKPAARDGSAGGASGDGSPGEQQPTAGLAALALLTELAAEAEGATPPAAAGSGPSGGPLTLEPSRGSLRSAGGSLGLLTPGMSGDASDLPACEKCDSPVALACSPAMAEPEPEAEAELEVPAAAGPAPPSPAAARAHLEGASALRDSPRTANRRATNTVANLVKKMVPSFRVSEAVGASLAGEQLPLSGDTPASKGAQGVSPARAGVPTAPVLFGVADDAEEAAASPCTKSKLAYGTVAQVVKKMVPSFRESEVMTSSLTGEQALAAAAVLAAAPSVCGGAGSTRVSAAGLPQAEPEGVQRLGSEEVPALEVEVEDEVLGLTQEEAPASAGPSGSSRPAPPELFVFGLAHEQPKIRTPTIKPRPNSAKANGGPKTPSSNDPAARKRKADEEVLPSAKVATPPSAAATSSSPPSASPAAAAAAAPSTPVAGTTISPFAPPAAPPDTPLTPPAPELSSMIVSELEPTASPLLEARSVNQPLKQEPAAPSPAAASSAAVATDAAAAAKAEEAVSAAVEVAASAEAAKATPVAEPPAKAAETVPVPKAAQEPKPKGFLAGLFRCFKP